MDKKYLLDIWQKFKSKSKNPFRTEKFSASSITSSEYTKQKSFDSGVKTQSSVLSIKISNENDENVVIQLYPQKRKCRENSKNVIKLKNMDKKSILRRQAAGGNSFDNNSIPKKNNTEIYGSCGEMFRETYGPTLDETILVGIETYKHLCKNSDEDDESVVAKKGSDYQLHTNNNGNRKSNGNGNNGNGNGNNGNDRVPCIGSNSTGNSKSNGRSIGNGNNNNNSNKFSFTKNGCTQNEPRTSNLSAPKVNKMPTYMQLDTIESSQTFYGTTQDSSAGDHYRATVTETNKKNGSLQNNKQPSHPEVISKYSNGSKNISCQIKVENLNDDTFTSPKIQKCNSRPSLNCDKTSSSRCQNRQVSLTKQLARDKKYPCTKLSNISVNAKFLDLDKRKSPCCGQINFCKSMYTEKELNILKKYIDIPVLGKCSFLNSTKNEQVASQESQNGENSEYLKVYRFSFKNPLFEMKQKSFPSTSTNSSRNRNISILSILNDESVLDVSEDNVYTREPIPEWQKKQTFPTAYFVQYTSTTDNKATSSSSDSDTDNNVRLICKRCKEPALQTDDVYNKEPVEKTSTKSTFSTTSSSSSDSITNRSLLSENSGCCCTNIHLGNSNCICREKCKCKAKCPSAVIFPTGQTFLPSIFKKIKKKSYTSSTEIYEIHRIIRSSSNQAQNGSLSICRCSSLEICNQNECSSCQEQNSGSSYSQVTHSTIYTREKPENFCELETRSSTNSLSTSKSTELTSRRSGKGKHNIEDTRSTMDESDYVPGEQIIPSERIPEELIILETIDEVHENKFHREKLPSFSTLERLEEEIDPEYKESSKVTILPSYKTFERSETCTTNIPPCCCTENLKVDNLGIQIAIISSKMKNDENKAIECKESCKKMMYSVDTQTDTCIQRKSKQDMYTETDTCIQHKCKQDMYTETETDTMCRPKSSVSLKEEKNYSESDSKNSLKKKRSSVTQSSNVSQTSKRDGSCEGTGLLKDRNIVPNETRYAITRVTRYDDFTTYEVMKSTKLKPKFIPCATEGVFIVKNKDRKTNCIPNS